MRRNRPSSPAWWEGELDRSKLNAGLNKDVDASDVETAVTTG